MIYERVNHYFRFKQNKSAVVPKNIIEFVKKKET
jgi:hypothetical protein